MMYSVQLQPPLMWRLNLSATVEFLLHCDFATLTIMHGTDYVNSNSSANSSMAIVNIKFVSKRKNEIRLVGLET